MRLIDADIYLKKICKYEADGCGSCKFQTVCPVDEPTVTAIPVEWITDWLTKQSIPATSYGIDYSAVEKMLEDWEEENGKAD